MTISHPTVGSVLNEQPPTGHTRTDQQPLGNHQRAAFHSAFDTVAAPMQRSAPPASPPPPSPSLLEPPERPAPKKNSQSSAEIGDFEVVYDDPSGYPLLAFADGHWFDVTSLSPRPVSVRYALRRDPAWAGAVVQTSCLWMRSHPHDERSFDLATELALAVGELVRQSQ